MAGRKERFLMEHILNLEQVKKYYGGNSGNITKAVDGISMYVDKGEFVAIMGASGSGKTTLLNCISTIDTVTSGHITVNNQDITKIKDKDFADFRRENLGFIFQDFNLLDTLTIEENISLSLVINKQNPADIDKRVHAIADKLGIRDILSKFPYEVSGGQKQRCACARALINEPKLILADEPTGALDSKASRLLLETMSEINKKMQATILMVTHDPFSASFCERILFLKDGKIFNEIFRGEKSRKDFFNEILDILLELRKMPLLSLNDNEYYIVTNSKFAYEVEDNKDIETITVANKNLKLKGYDTKSYWNSITNTGRFVVVLPDKYVQGLEVSENHLIIDTKEETDAELENKIKEDMQHQLVKVDKNGEINDESYRVNVRGAEIEQQKAMVAIVASLFMYIAFILISAVGTILAVQSLSDSTKYKYRYLTLRRLGINDKSLFKTIRKQLLILFCVPAISAILCSFVMMSSLNNVYQQILGDKHLYLIYFGLNLIIFFLIYSIYWIATYIGFKRNINEES